MLRKTQAPILVEICNCEASRDLEPKKNSLTLLYSNLDMLKHLHFRALFTPSWVHHCAVAILTIVGVPLRCYVVFHNPGNARCGLCWARQRWLEGGLQTIFRVASFSGTGLCETVLFVAHLCIYNWRQVVSEFNTARHGKIRIREMSEKVLQK